MKNIRSITIVTAQGVKHYQVGDKVNDEPVDRITMAELYFQGDPFDHYIGYTSNGKALFSINCLVPCVIEY